MIKAIVFALGSFLLFSHGSDSLVTSRQPERQDNQTGTLQKLIVANGNVAMNIDLSRLTAGKPQSQRSRLNFAVAPDSFFTILVFNGELRDLESGSMPLVPQNTVPLPVTLNASLNQLVGAAPVSSLDDALVKRCI